MQDNVRSGALIMANELREVGYDQITAAALPLLQVRFPGQRWWRAPTPTCVRSARTRSSTGPMRGLGYTCQLSAGTNDVVVINNPNDVRQWQALRTLTTTDSLMLYIENDKTTSGDDMWLTVGLTAAPVAQNCPDGTAGIRFRIGIPAGLLITLRDRVREHVRRRTGARLRADADAVLYVGRESLAGHALASVDGGHHARAGAGAVERHGHRPPAHLPRRQQADATTVADNVRSIQVSLQSASDEVVRTTGRYAKLDSLTMTTRVALRNALRP